MKTLVIDNSNGRTKFALAEGTILLGSTRLCPTSELEAPRLDALLADWVFDRVALCSVVPKAAEILHLYFCGKGMPPVTLAPCDALPVDFSAYGTATLGADRIANAVAAAVGFPGQAWAVIDAGTATTVDVLLPAQDGAKARFLGGAIAPGVATLARSLSQATACLPDIPLEPPAVALGRETKEAMQSGCILGYRGLLRGLLAAMEQECGASLRPLLTGGDAALLADLLGSEALQAPQLTLQGIAHCAVAMQAGGK